MKTRISLFFVIVILLQSCRVYHTTPVPIEEAVASKKRVKIHMNDGTRLRFKSIVRDSNQFYGKKKMRGEIVKTPLNLEHIDKIRLHNKPMSIILGALGVLSLTMVVGLVIALSNLSINLGSPAAVAW